MKKENYKKRVNVLDRGYVRCRDVMGNDLTPVNAAKVSFDKESASLTERDVKLIKFLAREGHTSPFRHAVMSLEIYAPLMVARQWWKYVVGSGIQEATGDSMDAWNESSRRYITEDVVFYIPGMDEWRSSPQNKKQGSGGPVDQIIGLEAVDRLMYQIEIGMKNYDWAIEQGIATEQARLFIPSAYGMYVRWWWTASLQSICHFLGQRLEHDAQWEIQQFAKAVLELAEDAFPFSVGELLNSHTGW